MVARSDLYRRCRFPVGREELGDLSDVHRRQTPQHIGQVGLGIDAPPPATDDQRVDHRGAPTGVGVPQEEPPATTDRGNADRVFDQIVVDFVGPRLEIAGEGRVLVEEIVHRLAQATLG